MPNHFFQFKQFCIRQDRTAMKVCTDGCVFGGWVDVDGSTRILDIGTGTGLLALMAAQRNATALIDAVEIEEAACGQAWENVQASPWRDRVSITNSPIQAFQPGYRYDLIIANPPFYHNHLRRHHLQQNLALHGEALSLPELAGSVHRLLRPDGRFAALLPPFQAGLLEELLAGIGMSATGKLHLYDYHGGKHIRTVSTYAYGAAQTHEDIFYIRDAANNYTPEFVQLMKPFYLHM